MSTACIEACIEVSSTHNLPLPLIASRRQIESAEFGGGYVGNLDTQSFSRFVQERSKNCPIFLARDHGGPYQNTFEVEQNFSVEKAMASAKRSFEADIDANFDMLHIDPSVPKPGESLNVDIILNRLFELYEHCFSYAQRRGRSIEFELGTEEQTGYGQDHEAFRYFLAKTHEFCKKNSITQPLFVVSQTGTKVLETENVGKVASYPNNVQKDYLENLAKSVSIAREYGLMLKEHNADYVSTQTLQLRPFMGIQACNVAPEFGVEETRALVYLLKANGLDAECERFLSISFDSGKWKKWMKPKSQASDFDRSIISGHYVFAHESVREIKANLGRSMAGRGQNLDLFLRNAIKAAIYRYLTAFNLV